MVYIVYPLKKNPSELPTKKKKQMVSKSDGNPKFELMEVGPSRHDEYFMLELSGA